MQMTTEHSEEMHTLEVACAEIIRTLMVKHEALEPDFNGFLHHDDRAALLHDFVNAVRSNPQIVRAYHKWEWGK